MIDTRDATSKPQSTSHAGGSNESTPKTNIDTVAAQSLFVAMALNMSWQLAIVVIVPIVGGYWLDGYFKTAPWLLLLGVVLSAAGIMVVLWRTVTMANERVGKLRQKDGGR